MRSLSVDHKKALTLLEEAARLASDASFSLSASAQPIQTIVAGSHLTYRYILVTALLGKATNTAVNPLALQAGADTKGAYDARSLCHSVIVPNEERLLLGGLGGSNEPYLNKPARFPMLSMENAVRNGKDRRTLKLLIETLQAVTRPTTAKTLLTDAVYIARKVGKERAEDFSNAVKDSAGGRGQVITFLQKLLAKPLHGETAVMVAGSILWLCESQKGYKPEILLHPVNEAGSSSNQISDIDVFDSGRLRITAEVKDKPFNLHDVTHAAYRVKAAGHSVVYFLKGPHGIMSDGDEETAVTDCAQNGVEVLFIDLKQAIPICGAFASPDTTLDKVAQMLIGSAEKARLKQETSAYLISLLSEMSAASVSQSIAKAASSSL